MEDKKESENQSQGTEQVTIYLPVYLIVELDRYRATTRQKRSDVVTQAISTFLNKIKKQKKGGVNGAIS